MLVSFDIPTITEIDLENISMEKQGGDWLLNDKYLCQKNSKLPLFEKNDLLCFLINYCLPVLEMCMLYSVNHWK